MFEKVRANATVLTQFKRLCVAASFSSACASEHRGRDERDGRTEGAQPLCLHLLSPRPPPLIDPTLLLPFHLKGVSLPPQITPSMYLRPPSSPMLGLSSAQASQPGATRSCNHYITNAYCWGGKLQNRRIAVGLIWFSKPEKNDAMFKNFHKSWIALIIIHS